jgi:hypothetical protein
MCSGVLMSGKPPLVEYILKWQQGRSRLPFRREDKDRKGREAELTKSTGYDPPFAVKANGQSDVKVQNI